MAKVSLLTMKTFSGHTVACDERCYNATGKVCECPCGGLNHGVGLEMALANTAAHRELWERQWRIKQNREYRISQDKLQSKQPIQLSLF